MQNLSSKAPATFEYELSKKLTALELGAISTELQGVVQSGCQCLVLDGCSVEEVDIAGINLLVKVYKTIKSFEGSMVIKLKKGGKLSAMLHITKYDKWFHLNYTE